MELLDLADDVIAVRIEGKISTEDMERITASVEDKLQRHAKLGAYVELVSFRGITLSGLLKDLELGFKRFDAFERKAVVTDKAWVTQMTPWFDRLFRTIELRTFAPDQQQAARAWIAGKAAEG